MVRGTPQRPVASRALCELIEPATRTESAELAESAHPARAALFLSPRTVEWHLRKVFAELGIRSRRELSGTLPSCASELAPA